MGSAVNAAAEAAIGLLSSLTSAAQVLTDLKAADFQDSMRRWSDLGIQMPAAILKPSCDEDVVKVVDHAVKNSIPFVAKAGGYSPWSTIGPQGWIIDNSLLTGISLDINNHTATIQAGVLTKQLNVTVADAGFCIQTPAASAVGYIPFLLGGGSTWLAGMYGLAVDSLLSARVVTAVKGLVTASETENEDLFWALKGAGQFFGLVTEVTVKIFPLKQKITTWSCIFAPSQIKEVAGALEILANGDDVVKSPGMAAILAPPGQAEPIVIVNTTHFRPEEEADRVVAPLLALKPIKQFKATIGFANVTDAGEALNKQSGFKYLNSCGMQTFKARKFEDSLDSFTKLIEEHPTARGSFFMHNWYSTKAIMERPESSAYSHRDIGVWTMTFISSQEEKAAIAAIHSGEEYLTMCQADQSDEEKALFPNHTRVHSIEQRYRGEERRRRLRKLKRAWDPEGVFTAQFL